MFLSVYNPPNGSSTLNDLYKFMTDRVTSFEYTERWRKAGEFTLTLPFDDYFISKIRIGDILYYDSYDCWLIAEGISYDYKRITITGYDLKRILMYRVSTFAQSQETGTEGYDVVMGTTSECIEHYLDNNFISPEDSNRAVRMKFCGNDDIGLSIDTYMARLEYVGDIIEYLCEHGEIGYRISFENFSAAAGFVVRLEAAVDKSSRSSNHSAGPRVVFSAYRGNVTALKFDHDISNLLNAVYATGAGVTMLVHRGDNVPQGLERRECAVGVNAPSVEDISTYALEQISENVETNSYDITAAASGYGTTYKIGDIVTVEEPELNNAYHATIVEASISQSAGNLSVQITLGKSKMKLLDRITNNLINGTLGGRKK